MTGVLRHRIKIGKTFFGQGQSTAGRGDQVRAACDGIAVAVDGDDATVRGREDRTRIAAGAEGRVDIDAVIMNVEETRRAGTEHGNVGAWSASDSREAVAAHHHSRAPGAFRASA